MKSKVFASIAMAALLGVSGLAATKSDYDHHYKLDGAKTWNFKLQMNNVKDLTGNNNGLWDRRIRRDIARQLAESRLTQTQNGTADLLVSYRLNATERVETQYLRTGYPGYFGYRGFQGRRWIGFGWHSGWGETTVWRTPYEKATLVMDVTDARTGQLVWRGYDTETFDFNKAEKDISKSVEHLTKRFEHDLKIG
ncbi:MAG: DUF4136 domain-containing protein [Blastocatellales bacterium]